MRKEINIQSKPRNVHISSSGNSIMATIHENYGNELLDMSTYKYFSRISCSVLLHKLAHNILKGTQMCTELEYNAPCNEAKTEYLLQCEQKAIWGYYLDPVTPEYKSASLVALSLISILCSHPRLNQPCSHLTLSLFHLKYMHCLLSRKH